VVLVESRDSYLGALTTGAANPSPRTTPPAPAVSSSSTSTTGLGYLSSLGTSSGYARKPKSPYTGFNVKPRAVESNSGYLGSLTGDVASSSLTLAPPTTSSGETFSRLTAPPPRAIPAVPVTYTGFNPRPRARDIGYGYLGALGGGEITREPTNAAVKLLAEVISLPDSLWAFGTGAAYRTDAMRCSLRALAGIASLSDSLWSSLDSGVLAGTVTVTDLLWVLGKVPAINALNTGSLSLTGEDTSPEPLPALGSGATERIPASSAGTALPGGRAKPASSYAWFNKKHRAPEYVHVGYLSSLAK